MNKKDSRITLHMVSSLDGFIAKKDNSTAWMNSTDTYEKGVELTEDYITKILDSIDCYVMGSNTYKHALELGWPYGKKPVFVVSQKQRQSDKENVQFYRGNLNHFVDQLLVPNYKNIWLVGGATLAKRFLKLGLIDDIIISILPILIGDGTLFFDHIGQEQRLHLKDVTAFKDGMVDLSYQVIKD